MNESVPIRNKDLLLYSAEKSVNEVCKLDESENITEEDAYFIIGTAIHWIADCIERLPNDIKNGEKKFTAIKFVHDRLKHSNMFEKAGVDEGHRFPLRYPLKYGPNYIWASLDNVEPKHDKNNFLEVYKKELEGKNIANSLSEILELIKMYYGNY